MKCVGRVPTPHDDQFAVGKGIVFVAVLVGEAVIFALHFTGATSFLWYNVVGCAVVILTGLLLSRLQSGAASES